MGTLNSLEKFRVWSYVKTLSCLGKTFLRNLDKAKSWLPNSNAISFTTWETLSKAFLGKYFPLGKTAKLWKDITSLYQEEGESLYEPWESFKELQRECPHHGIPNWLLVQTFYNGLKQPMKISIDVTAGGALMAKPINEAKQLFEDMTSNNYHWGGERG